MGSDKGKVKRKLVDQKKEIKRERTPQGKHFSVLNTSNKRLSNVENPDRIEDRIMKSHTKVKTRKSQTLKNNKEM